MNINKLFLSGVIALAVVACTSDNESPATPKNGSTYASVNVTLNSAVSRAISNSQENDPGTNEENKLNDLSILSSAASTPSSFNYAESGEAEGTFWPVNKTYYTTAPWPTNPGSQALALIFNKNGITPGAVTETGTTEYSGELEGLTAPNFTMTSKGFSVNVLPNISKEAAKNGTDLSSNVFAGIELERVVAKGVVVKAADFDDKVKDGNTVVGTVSDITFAAVNGAKKTFLYRDNAGSRTMATSGSYQYEDFKSLIDGLQPIENDAAADAAGLVRLGIENVPKAVREAKSVNEKVDDMTNAFYFMENSGDISGADMKEKGFYRFAYAKVYAVYTPTSVLEVMDNEVKIIPKEGYGEYYNPTTFDKGTKDDGVSIEGFLVWRNLAPITLPAGTTFYKGVEDGVLYASIGAAHASTSAPGQSAYTYKNGKCGYRALWNRQIEDGSSNPEVIVNANTRRNNTYVLSIKGFAKLGFPWDESDPNDPNLPKGEKEDPNLPNPTDPNIETSETYMRIEAVVLPWNLVERDDIILQ